MREEPIVLDEEDLKFEPGTTEVKKEAKPEKFDEEGVVLKVESSRTGWGGKTREMILKDRENYRLGEFDAVADVDYAILAQAEIERAEQALEDLRARGREDGDEWQRQVQRKQHYTKMLELTPPEARPTSEDRQLESVLQKAKKEFNAKIAELRLTDEKIEKLRTKGKLPKELVDLETLMEELKGKQESNKARKILKVAEVMNIPSHDDFIKKFKTGNMVYERQQGGKHGWNEWKIAYIPRVDFGSRPTAVLQRGEGDQAEFKIWPLESIERRKSRDEVDKLVKEGAAPPPI